MIDDYKKQIDQIKANVMSNVKLLLKQNNISLVDFSSKTSVGYGALYNIVNNNANYTLETLVKISSTLNLSISQLIGEVDLKEPQYTKSVPIIKWTNILDFIQPVTPSVKSTDFITVTSNTHELHQMFAIRSNEQTLYNFPADTIFVFNRIEHNIKTYDNRFVISVTNDTLMQFCKLIVSGDDIFLQNYHPHIPPSRITENTKIIAYVHETHTRFNSLPTLNW